MYATVLDYSAGVLKARLDFTREIVQPSFIRSIEPAYLVAGARVVIVGEENTGYTVIGIITTPGASGYALFGGCAEFSPADATTYFFGILPNEVPTTTANRVRIYIPYPARIHTARIFWTTYNGVAGSGESIELYIRLNNTTDTLISAIANTNAAKVFSNLALSIDVVSGDYIELKMITPTWATNPTLAKLGGHIYLE